LLIALRKGGFSWECAEMRTKKIKLLIVCVHVCKYVVNLDLLTASRPIAS